MLEAVVSSAASFVTLTYDKEHIPNGETVVPRHLQLWLKRVRKHMACRFYGVGEYGDRSERPHYHVALFGIGPREAEVIGQRTWTDGFVHVGDLTFQSAAYIAGYVTKKMTRTDDPRLGNRHPEFARMSLRPGIGAHSISTIADALCNKHGWNHISQAGDVPTTLKIGGKDWPLGRYLTRKLREAMNFEEIGEQPETASRRSAEMLALYSHYLATEEVPLGTKDMLIKNGAQRALRMESREKIRRSKTL